MARPGKLPRASKWTACWPSGSFPATPSTESTWLLVAILWKCPFRVDHGASGMYGPPPNCKRIRDGRGGELFLLRSSKGPHRIGRPLQAEQRHKDDLTFLPLQPCDSQIFMKILRWYNQ